MKNRLIVTSIVLALVSGTVSRAIAETPAAIISPAADARTETRSASYQINHTLSVTEIPGGAKKARVWFWLPDEDSSQKLLDLSISHTPSGYQITRDATNGHRYLYAEVINPESSLSIATEFTLRRTAVSVALDPTKAGALTEIHRTEFAEYLRRDVPNMEVTSDITALAEKICGQEQNVVRQARLLFDWVVDNNNHYSKPGAPKSSGKGSVEYCLANKGGACTDLHSLFIAMARSRGIPTRLHFGSMLKVANEGKEMDPGYRCWVEYFVPNYGWVPMDIAAANTNPAQRDFYFSGIDERRVHFIEGRDLDLSPRQDGPKLNLMIIAYVEVDGKPLTTFKRVLKFNEIKSLASNSQAAANTAATNHNVGRTTVR
jgi:transglutaminase-like putative cysteine protease